MILAGDLIPSEALADQLRSSHFEAVEIVHIFAEVVAVGLLVQVTEQMERFDTHVGSADAALQERPEVLKGIGVDVSIDVLNGMVYDLMGVIGCQSFVGHQSVRVECRARFNMLSDLRLKRFLLAVRNDDSADLPAALHDPEHRSLILAASAGDAAFPFGNVHIPRLAANESLVGLDMAAGFFNGAIVQRHANAVIQEPCRFLSDTDVLGYLAGTNSVLAIDNEPQRHKPFVDADGRVFHQGAGLQ